MPKEQFSVFRKNEEFLHKNPENIKFNYKLYIESYLNHFLNNFDYLSAQVKFNDIYLEKKELDELSILYTLKHQELRRKYGDDEEILGKEFYTPNALEFEITRLLRSKAALYFENLYYSAKEVFACFSYDSYLQTMRTFNARKFLSCFNFSITEYNKDNKTSRVYGGKRAVKNKETNTPSVVQRNETSFLFNVSKKYFGKNYQVSISFGIPKEFSEIFDKEAFGLFCQFLISSEDEDINRAFSHPVAEGMFLNILLGEKTQTDNFLNIQFAAKDSPLIIFNPASLKGLTTRSKFIEVLNFYAFYVLNKGLQNWVKSVDSRLNASITVRESNKELVDFDEAVLERVRESIKFCQNVFNGYAFLYFISADPSSSEIKPLFEKIKAGNEVFETKQVGDSIELSYGNLKICNITVIKRNKLLDVSTLKQQEINTLLKLKKIKEAFQKNGLDASEVINKLSSLFLIDAAEEAKKLSSLIDNRKSLSSSLEELKVCVNFY